ncbi:MAG: hypothetical protein AAFQ94_08035 [Bacteroidota bacterium]
MKTLITLFFLCSPFIVLGQEPSPRFLLKNAAELEEKYLFVSLFYAEQISTEDIQNAVNTEKEGLKRAPEFSATSSLKKHRSYENYLIINLPQLIRKGEMYSLHVIEKATGELMSVFVRSGEEMDFGYSIAISDFRFEGGNYFYDQCTSRRKYRDETIADQSFLTYQNRSRIEQMISLKDSRKHNVSIRKLNRFLRKTNCKK